MGRKCCICESPVKNGRCTECGMLYRRDEELYHLNEPRREHLRHAGAEARRQLESREVGAGGKDPASSDGKTVKQKKSERKTPEKTARTGSSRKKAQTKRTTVKEADDKKKKGQVLGGILGVIGLAIALFNMGKSTFVSVDPAGEIPEPPSWNTLASEEVVLGEEEAQFTLTSGVYLVGRDLPQGSYDVRMTDERTMSITLQSSDFGGYEYYSFFPEADEEDEYQVESLEGVLLPEGTYLIVDGPAGLSFETDSGFLEEPLKESEKLSEQTVTIGGEKETFVVGEDIPPGIYDGVLLQGYGGVYTIDNDVEPNVSFYLSPYGENHPKEFRNIPLREGMDVTVMGVDGFQIELIPVVFS